MGMKTKIVYSKKYGVDIGAHVFPTQKYRMIKERMESEKALFPGIDFVEPPCADEKDVLLVHDKTYIDKLKKAKLSEQEMLTLELPYSKELVYGAFLCCGGTILASELALEQRIGIHVGGGFHHAFPDHGEGFCVLNDIAVAVRKLKKDKKIQRALIIDCDLHQGNGSAFIFADDKGVFTFSIHQEHNYPFYKPESDLDIGLPDRTKDKVYLKYLEESIPKIISDFKPDFIIYVAGADPYEKDQIGNLAVTIDGLEQRDEFIFSQGLHYGVPMAMVLAGGYAYNYNDTVKIHFNTIKTAIKVFST